MPWPTIIWAPRRLRRLKDLSRKGVYDSYPYPSVIVNLDLASNRRPIAYLQLPRLQNSVSLMN
jgi:hypothetical protein